MKIRKEIIYFIPLYILCPVLLIGFSLFVSKAVTVYFENQPFVFQCTFVIDAGHGGVDGGATSCTGVLESNINLQISLKLNDMMHLLGLNTIMIRTEDVSVYTSGTTIAAKKVSDLKERMRIINEQPGAVLLSIHQNYFTDSRYKGAQIFYGTHSNSRVFAEKMQHTFVDMLNTDRKAKKADGVYLMQHVNCPAILIECGFISNPIEESLLLNDEYQKKLCAVIASVCSQYSQQISNLA